MRKWFFHERFSYADLIVILIVVGVIRAVLDLIWR